MDQLLKQRLEILKEAGEISEEIKSVVIDFAENFERKYSIAMTEENSAMLITHLAMALVRVKNEEKIDEMDEISLNEVKKYDVFNELYEFHKKIEGNLNIVIPESERGFIALHATALINKFK